MKIVMCIFCVLFCSANAQAWSNFVENPYTPYPPGCATLPDLQTALYGDHAVKVFEGQIEQFDASVPESLIPVDLSVYRVACADHNRSIVMVELSIPSPLRSMGASIWAPGVSVYHGEDSSSYVEMRLNREPKSWDDGRYPGFNEILGGRDEDMMDSNDGPWLFVLDNYSSETLQRSVMSPTDYNDDLVIAFPGGMSPYLVTVPSTASLFSASVSASMSLSGRLSGTWVDEGASDQGFVLTISEMVPNAIPEPSRLLESRLLMFFSWYTFDADGGMLWLAGNAEFQIGATSVTVPLVRVTNGEFMGNKVADREVVGSATITGVNCNDLAFEYTLDSIGLDSGISHLQRIYSLETAGYTCRDLEARMETAQ